MAVDWPCKSHCLACTHISEGGILLSHVHGNWESKHLNGRFEGTFLSVPSHSVFSYDGFSRNLSTLWRARGKTRPKVGDFQVSTLFCSIYITKKPQELFPIDNNWMTFSERVTFEVQHKGKKCEKKTCFDMEINSKSVWFIMFSIWCWIRETFQCIDSAWMNSMIIFVWNQASSWAYFLVRVFIKLCCWGWKGSHLVYYICSKIWPSED